SDRGLERRYIITSIQDLTPERLHKDLYCKRGRAEQFIKEMKSLKCTRLSCQEFFANQFRLLLHGLAYLLMFKLRALLPREFHVWSLISVRTTFLKVAAQIKFTARCVWIRWSSSYSSQARLLALCRKLDALQSAQ